MEKLPLMMMKSLVKTHQFNNEGTNEDTRRDGIMEGQVWSGIRVKTMYKSKKNIFSLYNKKHLKKLEKCADANISQLYQQISHNCSLKHAKIKHQTVKIGTDQKYIINHKSSIITN